MQLSKRAKLGQSLSREMTLLKDMESRQYMSLPVNHHSVTSLLAVRRYKTDQLLH